MDASVLAITPGTMPVCAGCSQKACELLLLGGALPGEFLFVREASHASTECPFAVTTVNDIEALCTAADPQKLHDRLCDLLGQLSPAEQTSFDQRTFISGFGDNAGRIAYVKTLWDNGIISVLQVPDTNVHHPF